MIVHLSTSNSNGRIPPAPYLRMWATTFMLLLFMLGASESVWRALGYLPSVVDTEQLWSHHRQNVYSDEKRRLVIVGSSRAQLGLDPATLAETFPEYEIVHLAINGTSPREIIRDLTADPAFDGLILVDANILLHPATVNGELHAQQYTAYFHNEFQSWASLEKRANGLIAGYLQSRLVVLSPALSLRILISTQPQPLYLHMQFNRYRPAHYYTRLTAVELEQHKQNLFARWSGQDPEPLTEEAFRTYFQDELAAQYRMLRARGGEMILVRMPATGDVWALEQALAPKEVFWDNVQPLSAVPTIHFLDDTELAGFTCPDDSHLDAADAVMFTRRLGQIMRDELGMEQED